MKQATINSSHQTISDKTKVQELDLDWVSLIYEAKAMGISITEIKEFLLNPDKIIQKGP